MGLTQNANSLGPPALNVVGFQLWIHSRQVPENQDYDDGNWLNVTAHCGANGASVWVTGAIIMVPDLARLMDECETLYESGLGQAARSSYEPELKVTLQPTDRMGHILMRVEITPDHMTQEHRMDFQIDQSYLPRIIEQCRAVIEEYPIRGGTGS